MDKQREKLEIEKQPEQSEGRNKIINESGTECSCRRMVRGKDKKHD